jgi:hypothetical protein
MRLTLKRDRFHFYEEEERLFVELWMSFYTVALYTILWLRQLVLNTEMPRSVNGEWRSSRPLGVTVFVFRN